MRRRRQFIEREEENDEERSPNRSDNIPEIQDFSTPVVDVNASEEDDGTVFFLK